MTDSVHIMVDIETLSTKPNAAVLSIALVEFDPTNGEVLDKMKVALSTYEQDNRHVDPNTVRWWVNQAKTNIQAVEASFTDDTVNLGDAIRMVKNFVTDKVFLSSGHRKNVNVWSCDPDFDLVILDNLFEELGFASPFYFFEHRSVRTMRMLGKMIFEDEFKHEATHDPYDDCVRQIKEVSRVMSAISNNFFPNL